MERTPRLRLLRTRRGWMIGTLAALATVGAGVGAGFQAGALAADGPTAACSATTTTTTTTTTAAGTTTADDACDTATTATSDQQETTTTTTGSTTSTSETTTTVATTTTTTTTTSTGATPPPSTTGAQQPKAAGDQAGPQTAGAGTQAVAPPSTPGTDTADQHADRGPGESDQKGAKDDADSDGKVEAVTPQRRHHKHKRVHRKHKRAHKHRSHRKHAAQDAQGKTRQAGPDSAAPSDQVYFPPVSVDWSELTPLAPPPLPGTAEEHFPGPTFLLPIFEAAAVQYDVPWQVLAAINEVETAWGQNQGPSSAGAIGWMQFMPATWRTFGMDANGDHVANPADPVDAIFSAARYLHDAGADHDLGRAIFAYNHSNQYVDQVVQRAIEFGSLPPDLLVALTQQGRRQADAIDRATGSKGLLDRDARITSVGRAMLLGAKRLQRHILADDNISVYECGREDIAGGIVDRRILEVLQYLASHGLRPTVSSLRCGHGYYTASGNVSEHSSGDAVDISAINGTPILGHQGPGSITEKTIKELLKLGGGMRPHQIISLMTFEGADNTLALGDHANHIHVGFAPARKFADL